MENGNPLTDKGRLANSEINLLQQYHGMAICGNADDAETMRRSRRAVYSHKLLTDSDPQHGIYPDGGESWGKYNKSVILNSLIQTKIHYHMLYY